MCRTNYTVGSIAVFHNEKKDNDFDRRRRSTLPRGRKLSWNHMVQRQNIEGTMDTSAGSRQCPNQQKTAFSQLVAVQVTVLAVLRRLESITGTSKSWRKHRTGRATRGHQSGGSVCISNSIRSAGSETVGTRTMRAVTILTQNREYHSQFLTTKFPKRRNGSRTDILAGKESRGEQCSVIMFA